MLREIHSTILPGFERTIKGVPLATNATEDNVMFKLGIAMNKPKMNPAYVKFALHGWREELEFRVEFNFQRQTLADVKKVELGTPKKKFNHEHVILIEADGA
jgi:hypothetical protein